MKLKKSSDSNRREKGSKKSLEEDALGLLSKENPADSLSNVKSSSKRGNKNWGARLGFGRSSAQNSNRNDTATTSSSKKIKKAMQVGYTKTLKTPKGMKDRATQQKPSPEQSRSSSSTSRSLRTTSQSTGFIVFTSSTTSSTKSKSKNHSIKKLAPPKGDTEEHWTPNFYHENPATQATSNQLATTFSPREQQLFNDEGLPAVTMEDCSDVAGGFEVTFEKEADSSRLTATTVSSVPTAATAAETISTTASPKSPMSACTTSSSHASFQSNPRSPIHHHPSKSPVVTNSPLSTRSLHSSPSPISVKSGKSHTSIKPLSSKSPQEASKSPKSVAKRHSPIAHAAAQALVALSDGEDLRQHDEDYGENDFDPEASSSDDEEYKMAGPESGSSFQYSLSANNLQSTGKCFRILPSKSSLSNASTSVMSQQTSASSSLFPPQTTSTCSSSIFPSSSTGDNNRHSPKNSTREPSTLLLSRPFGRSSLPPFPWIVQVSPAEWDNPERRWKYRIQVQSQAGPPTSPTAVTWRSMENFVWLQDALRTEFNGGLLIPSLSIAVGMTDLEQATHEVDSTLLKDWLMDVLNGVRGQGELLLGHKSVDLLRSDAMEAFLYRNTQISLQKPGNLITSMMGEAFVAKQEAFIKKQKEQQQQQSLQQQPTDYHDDDEEERTCQEAMCKPSPRSRHSPTSPSTLHSRQPQHESFASSFWSQGPLALITDELCTGMGCQVVEDSPTSSTGSSISSPGARPERDTLHVQDSFLDASTIASMRSSDTGQRQQPPNPQKLLLSPATPNPWKYAQSTELIKAERDLVLCYRRNALQVLEKVQVLMEEEENIGLAWKRFGIAVSNLFSYEKEVENARLGEKKIHRDAMPYRKVKKTIVDQAVKTLMQQKSDRSVPALRFLRSMLTAYVADLSAVSPSVEAYLEGMDEIAALDQYFAFQGMQRQRKGRSLKHGSSTDSTSSPTSSDDNNNNNNSLFQSVSRRLRSFTAPSTEEDQKPEQGIVPTTSSSSNGNASDDELPAPASDLLKKRLIEDRIMANERLLRESLTTLCKSTTMRSARMAYAFFKSEAAQCGLLRSAAASVRSKIEGHCVQDAVSEMSSRHQTENKKDMKTELALAQRIVNLGNRKRYPLVDGKDATEGDLHNDEKEHAMAIMRDNALQVARERVGRWNSELAMSIMKAVGVSDPNVRVEETTRELRLVRKYAIGLRENLNRCIEAVDLLRQAVLKGKRRDLKGVEKRKSGKHIRETRKEYFAEVAKLFSGVAADSETASPKKSLPPPHPKTLLRAGIKMNDPLGWSTPFVELSSKVDKAGSSQADCGSVAQKYIEIRDSQAEWLLSSISGLLNEYTQRVEVVESFVYMECVGVQLEKHFSNRRTQALSAFEKKTDVTTAINIATRKRIPKLVEELKAKLERFGPDVTHTSVKETKEAHLESKAVKTELHELALCRLLRARETSTERVIDLLRFWMKEEESACLSELDVLGDIMEALETSCLGAIDS